MDHDSIGTLLRNEEPLYYCRCNGGHTFEQPDDSTLPQPYAVLENIGEHCPPNEELEKENKILSAYERSTHPPIDRVHCAHCGALMECKGFVPADKKYTGMAKFECPICEKVVNLLF